MEAYLIPILSAVASFIGSYCALKVHVEYLRRDVDRALAAAEEAHKRIDWIQGIKN